MANYTCTKCSATCYSKCTNQRTIFPTGDYKSISFFESMCSIDIKDEGKGRTYHTKPEVPIQELHVNLTLWDDQLELPKAIEALISDLTRYQPLIPMMVCRHEWELLDEHCDLHCCKRKEV